MIKGTASRSTASRSITPSQNRPVKGRPASRPRPAGGYPAAASASPPPATHGAPAMGRETIPTDPESLKVTPMMHLKTLTKGKLWTVQDFDVRQTIGLGTFSRIHFVKIKGDRTPLALKVLKKAEIIKLKQVVHTMNEKTVMSIVSHPFVINCLTTFQDERRLYILLEYVSGGDLFAHLRREGRFPNDHARFYAAELILALAYLHTLFIVYRDVKPENYLLDGHGHLKLADFGFAKVIDPGSKTYTLCGTPEYMAPEIVKGFGHDRGVDEWALGVLLFEMINGSPPFIGSSPFDTYQKVISGTFVFARHFDVKVKDLIRKLLTPEVEERIGCSRRGEEEIKRHRWFKGLDWDMLLNKAVPPPFIPNLSSSDDTSMFETYPDSDEIPPQVAPKEQARFEGFSAEVN